MAIERVDFPINSMVDLSIAMLVHQRVIVILLQHHQHHNIIINNRRIISPGEALPCSNSCAKSTWWQGRHNRRKIGEGIPSGKRLHNYRKSPCYQWENPLFLWWLSIVMVMFTRGVGFWDQPSTSHWEAARRSPESLADARAGGPGSRLGAGL